MLIKIQGELARRIGKIDPCACVYICVCACRGDQGFCSEECRWQQILVDEAREREAAAVMSNKELQRRAQARHHSPHRTPMPIRGRPPRKTLAVA
jgi:hypothetical protein